MKKVLFTLALIVFISERCIGAPPRCNCGPGQYCKLQQVYCFTTSCPPIAVCVDNPTCAGVNCGPGKYCKIVQPQCFTTPCPPLPECLDLPTTSSATNVTSS
ncbi:hypothetical protein L9F63_023625 [Diploptera punctata]|uniref:Uncharacterized protein n=1 Tax=Diploptera punctata TaxID=6984 RepID=A0AAD7ZI97_DIPPU|nr:hypothetical protein L9F63_023625 [Diploptera punctata]